MLGDTVDSPHLDRARELVKRGQFKQAIDEIEEGLRIAPTNPELHFALGYCLASQGEKQHAILCYERALSNDPVHPQALRFLGLAYIEAGRVRDGVAYIKRAFKQIDREGKSTTNTSGAKMVETYEEQKALLSIEIEAMRIECSTLRADISHLHVHKSQLIVETTTLEEQVQAKETQVQALQDAYIDLKSKHEIAELNLKKAEQETAKHDEEDEKLKRKITASRKQIASLIADDEQLRQTQSNLCNDIEILKQQRTTLLAEKSHLEHDLETIRSSIASEQLKPLRDMSKARELSLPSWLGTDVTKDTLTRKEN